MSTRRGKCTRWRAIGLVRVSSGVFRIHTSPGEDIRGLTLSWNTHTYEPSIFIYYNMIKIHQTVVSKYPETLDLKV